MMYQWVLKMGLEICSLSVKGFRNWNVINGYIDMSV